MREIPPAGWGRVQHVAKNGQESRPPDPATGSPRRERSPGSPGARPRRAWVRPQRRNSQPLWTRLLLFRVAPAPQGGRAWDGPRGPLSIVSVATAETPRAPLDVVTAPTTPRALTTRFLDFWLLGGASIAVWLVMIGVQGFRASWAIDQHFKNLTYTAASLSLLINYPHFLVSYKLAYQRGRPFVLAHWWQLIAVPAALVAVFAVAFAAYDRSVRSEEHT